MTKYTYRLMVRRDELAGNKKDELLQTLDIHSCMHPDVYSFCTHYKHGFTKESDTKTIAKWIVSDVIRHEGTCANQTEEELDKGVIPASLLPDKSVSRGTKYICNQMGEAIEKALLELQTKYASQLINAPFDLLVRWNHHRADVLLHCRCIEEIYIESDTVYVGDPCYKVPEDESKLAEAGLTKVKVRPGRYIVHIFRAEDNLRPEYIQIVHEDVEPTMSGPHGYISEHLYELEDDRIRYCLPVDSGQFGIYDADFRNQLGGESEVYHDICEGTCRMQVFPDMYNLGNGFVTSTHNGDGTTVIKTYTASNSAKDIRGELGETVAFQFNLS